MSNLFLSENNNLFMKVNNGYVCVDLTVKDKVETKVLGIESYTIVPSNKKIPTLKETRPTSVEEMINKFHITESNPFISNKTTKGTKPVEKPESISDELNLFGDTK